MSTTFEREFLRAKRYASALSLAMIDIDHFKEINDTYGHQFGDYVLREISKMIYESFRKTDMVYRYGGEELAVILTETSIENAMIPIERIADKKFPSDRSRITEKLQTLQSAWAWAHI